MTGRVSTFHLLLLSTSVTSLATVVAAQGTCNLLGEVFVTNPFGQALMIKGDGSADISTIQFSSKTQFVQVTVERKPAGEFDPKNLQVGDRLCIQFDTAQGQTASRILVMKRLDIQEHQKQVFSTMMRNRAFGVVTELNAEKGTIRMREELQGGASQPLTVEASDSVAFRHYSSDAQAGVASSWAHLRVGDRIYVQGRRDIGSSAIRAGLILVGGVRDMLGTITSMNGVGDVLELQEIGSGRSMTVRIQGGAVYRASPFVEAAITRERPGSAVSWDLQPISFSDLQKGDTVSVLAWEEDGGREPAAGLMVVTGFGSYRTNALSTSAPTFWYLDPFKAPH
jgi:hypothetical protein